MIESKFSLFGIIVATVLGLTTIFFGCTKEDVNAVVNYYGKVNYINTSTPFPDLEVKVTDGDNTHCLTHTDAEGKFSLSVKVEEINGNYYILVGDSTCVTKKVNLPGFGQPEIDLGTIEIEGPKVPVVTTAKVNSVTAESAVCGGNVTDDGRLTVTARGVCWSKTEYPTTQDTHTTNGSGKGEFTSELKDLEFGMKYYVRAYATNRMGTSYGEQISFTTNSGLPVVVTDTVSDILSTSATCGGIVEESGYSISACGICWSAKTSTPTLDDEHTTEVGKAGHFNSLMTNLERSTTYYVRAYAVNEKGTGYGEAISFTTISGLPIVSTDSITDIRSQTAKCNGNVVDDGGYRIIARGACWSRTSSTPTISDDHTNEFADNGIYNSLLTKLELNTTYYVRAYATNEVGTSYGKSLSFTTGTGLPSIVTLKVSSITESSAETGGNVLDDYGFPIIDRGICWRQSPSPTINDNKISEGSGVGLYRTTITGIDITNEENIYYIRAYATNENGTSYGNEISVSYQHYKYEQLPRIEYNGDIYVLLDDMGALDLTKAQTMCENLVFAGYDDWMLPPTVAILKLIMTKHKDGWKKSDGTPFHFTEESSPVVVPYYSNSDTKDPKVDINGNAFTEVFDKCSAEYWISPTLYEDRKDTYYTCGYSYTTEWYENGEKTKYISTSSVKHYFNNVHEHWSEINTPCRVRPVRKYKK